MKLTDEEFKVKLDELIEYQTGWLMGNYFNPVDQELAHIQFNALTALKNATEARAKLKESYHYSGT